MAAKLPSIQFYPADWTRDAVSCCSLAAQGLWLRMMFIAHDCDPYGHLVMDRKPIPSDLLARRCGCDLEQFLTLLTELEHAGVPSRTKAGIIFSRRMVRDAAKREESKRYGSLGGNPNIIQRVDQTPNGRVNPPVNPPQKRKKKTKLKSPGMGVQGEGADTLRNEFFDLIPEKLRESRFLEAWAAWIQHRHHRKPVYTEIAAKRALPMLEKEGVDAAIERIDRSIANGWQGLFFTGEKNGNGNGNGRHVSRHEQNIADIEKTLESL